MGEEGENDKMKEGREGGEKMKGGKMEERKFGSKGRWRE